jgi:acetyl esterase/lipase
MSPKIFDKTFSARLDDCLSNAFLRMVLAGLCGLCASELIAQPSELPVSAALMQASTSSRFFGGATFDDGITYTKCFDAGEVIDIDALIEVESEHVGSSGSLYVIAEADNGLFFLAESGFDSWDGNIDTLQPVMSKTLVQQEELKIVDDLVFAAAGINDASIRFFLAYASDLVPDELYYSSVPISLVIREGYARSPSSQLTPAEFPYAGVDACKPYNVRVTEALVYGSGPIAAPTSQNVDLLLDLYEPDVELSGHSVPLMVIIPGGGFVAVSRAQSELVSFAEEFARQGYIVISLDYRLSPQLPILSQDFELLKSALQVGPAAESLALGMVAASEDALLATKWIVTTVAQQGVSVPGIGLLGSSAGAVTALNLAYALDNFGISVPDMKVVVGLWGSLLMDRSRGDMIAADDAPVIMVHGTADARVDYEKGSLAIANRAMQIGLPYELISNVGKGHSFNENLLHSTESFPNSGTTQFQRIVDFVNTAMLNEECLRQAGSIELCQ